MRILGSELGVLWNQILAIVYNIWEWFKSFLSLGSGAGGDSTQLSRNRAKGEQCVVVQGPGGLDRLQMIPLAQQEYPYADRATIGYNIKGIPPPFVRINKQNCSDGLRPDLLLVRITNFSVNYADVCIRFGLYESAMRYVGYPIVPGFDCSGVVVWAGEDTDFTPGDKVFGFTMFGSYTSLLVVPANQMRKTPKQLSQEKAAALPATAATALHAIALAGGWPQPVITKNKAALVHSAGGGVGSMLIQMLRRQGFSPIVGVVGSSFKVQYVKALGADYVIDKSTHSLWSEAKKISPDGFSAIFDANGVETLNDSYEHLARCGKLIIYGFHTNIPKATSLLSPFSWIGMILKMIRMPSFLPMNLTLESKSVCGFNLSFFADEHELIKVRGTRATAYSNS
jgi:NADPH:quinone reductase-like Zn-dependent oxidoreductase